MPRAPPQNMFRAFKTRTNGIFKKASELHELDDSVRITVIIEKRGSIPLVFTTEDGPPSWPPLMQDYVDDRQPVVKRPFHYQSIDDGILGGKVRVTGSASASPSPPRYLSHPDSRDQTPGIMEDDRTMGEDEDRLGNYHLREPYMSGTPPRKMSVRTSSPLPIPFVLPSKMSGDNGIHVDTNRTTCM